VDVTAQRLKPDDFLTIVNDVPTIVVTVKILPDLRIFD
jgi:hypothetical protein